MGRRARFFNMRAEMKKMPTRRVGIKVHGSQEGACALPSGYLTMFRMKLVNVHIKGNAGRL